MLCLNELSMKISCLASGRGNIIIEINEWLWEPASLVPMI